MPHVIIEYSANVADLIEVDTMVDAVHDATLTTGAAPLDALRTRAVAREHYAIADRDPSNAFVAITARFGAGRSAADRRSVIDAVMAALERSLGAAQRHVMLSVEFQEIDPELRINKNNLRPVIAERLADDDTGPTE